MKNENLSGIKEVYMKESFQISQEFYLASVGSFFFIRHADHSQHEVD